MGRVIRYVSQEKKTMDETGRRYLSGINCTPELAQKSFLTTKNLYGKASGTFFYQYVQSFSPKEEVAPAEAHQIAQELAERFFPGCEVLVATHIDTEHLHSHLIVNSVHPDTGKKLHFIPNTLEQMRKVSDQICMEHGLTTLKPYQQDRRTQGLRTREYRAANRGDSWKFQLIITIEEVMKRAGTREEFLREMNQQGYQVRWEEGRKSITYPTPTGKTCRDDKLHELKFRKEQMEHEFRIRRRAAQQFTGHPEAATESITNISHLHRPAGQHPLHHANPNRRAAGASPAEHPGPPGEHPERNGFSGHQKEPGASGHSGPAGPLAEPDGGASSEYVRGLEESPAWDPGGEPTGWEAERRIYEAALRTGPGVPGRWLEADEYLPEMGSPHDSEFHGGGRGDQHPDLQAADVTEDVLRLLARLEQQADSDVMDATTRHSHGNRKALTKEQAKKIAMGHKADDHEEGQKNELSDFPQHSGNLKCWGESLAGRFKK